MIDQSGDMSRGHHRRPHTADVCIEAWAPTAGECYDELVAALVELFADVGGAAGGEARRFEVGPGTPEELVVLLLEEVLAIVDIDGLVVRATTVDQNEGDQLSGTLLLVPLHAVEATGPVAKGISFEDLSFQAHGEQWRGRAIVDV